MKYFLEMIEVAKRQKHIMFGTPTKGSNQLSAVKTKDINIFLDLAEVCQPFVFSPDKNKKIIRSDDSSTYDAPFPVWCMEMGEEHCVAQQNHNGKVVTVLAVMCAENKQSDMWHYYLLIDTMTGRQVVETTGLNFLARHYTDCMNSDKYWIGTEKVRERIKVGTGVTKRTITIRKVVHVRPKTEAKQTTSERGRIIQWGHRWWVRGHWRITEEGRIGKNRDGLYCELGRTWVTEHVKGPEDQTLVSKTRVIERN